MKNHILSSYQNNIPNKKSVYGPTNITETIETSDADEIISGPTYITHSIETSDPDDMVTEFVD